MTEPNSAFEANYFADLVDSLEQVTRSLATGWATYRSADQDAARQRVLDAYAGAVAERDRVQALFVELVARYKEEQRGLVQEREENERLREEIRNLRTPIDAEYVTPCVCGHQASAHLKPFDEARGCNEADCICKDYEAQ